MVLYGTFLELHDFYTQEPMLLRANWIAGVCTVGDATYINYIAGGKGNIVVEEDYETVKGLLGQIYGKKN